jgi:uncharacterized GH25 family protein
MKRILTLFCSALIILIPSIAFSHNLWLNVSDYSPKVGESVEIEIGWGHQFPKDEVIGEGIIKEIYALDPAGEKISLKKISSSHFNLKPNRRGSYSLVAMINPVFFSITTKGRKMGNKRELKNVVQCTYYDIRAKGIIAVAGGDKGFSRQVDPVLEIVPLTSPGNLKEGDSFPLKVLFQGKPLSGVYLEATYAGCPSQEASFGHKTVAVSFVHKVQTDKHGETVIKLVKKGNWMVKVNHKIPFPDPEECDEYSYSTTLTFEVK